MVSINEGQSATIRGLTDSMAQLRGDVLESKLTGRIPPLIAREFDVRRVYPICSGGLPPMNPRMEEFERTLEEAADEGKITDDDETRLRVTDLIVRSQRRSDRSTLWFAIEASGVIDDYDITRAKHSADVLKEIHAQDAIPLVYGYQISDRYRDLANALQVSVFWTRTGSSRIRSPTRMGPHEVARRLEIRGWHILDSRFRESDVTTAD